MGNIYILMTPLLKKSINKLILWDLKQVLQSKWETEMGLDSKANPLLISSLGSNQGASWDSN